MKSPNEHFETGRKVVGDTDTGSAAEHSMLTKEVARLLGEARRFESSGVARNRKLMIAALWVAGIAIVTSIAQAIAITVMMPLKTIEPFIVYVDRIAGVAEVREPLKQSLSTYGEESDRYFIGQYVIARESYDWGLAQRNYDTVKSYSLTNGSVFNEYDQFIKSPKSPLQILGEKARVVTDITSVTLDVKTRSATVRFNKSVVGPDGRSSTNIPKTYWVATVRYEYPNPRLTPAERRFNPLGMQIPSYQLVQEYRSEP